MKNAVRSFACACACLFTLASFAALPSGYTRLEYIQGNGTDGRILTDFTPKPTTDKIVAEVAFVSTANNGTIWCARGNGSQVATWTLFRIGDTFRFDYNTAVAVTTTELSLDTKYTVTAENKTFSWSGGAGGSSALGDLTQAGGPIMLFASYHSGTGNNLANFSNHKLYSFKIYRNNQLIHDFIPCTDADGNATLYDDVASGQATLTRTGIFTAGPAYDVYALRVEAPATQRYEGSPCTPHPNVYNRLTGELLTENTHYTLSWSNNSAPGTATVTATGKAGSDYEGREASANFTILGLEYQDSYVMVYDKNVSRHDVGNRVVYVFTNAASVTSVKFLQQMTIEEYLLVGGGGGGGETIAGGGGGGGVIHGLADYYLLPANTVMSVTVGAGGPGKPSVGKTQFGGRGQNGGTSFFQYGDYASPIAFGGSGGWGFDAAAVATGNLGSAGGKANGNNGVTQTDGTHYTSAQMGHKGGSCSGSNSGGGGGGATENGGNGSGSAGGKGGEGYACSITGTSEVYGSGGGGGTGNSGTTGGAGGTNAGKGANNDSGSAGAAMAGFGGGGGGGRYKNDDKNQGGAGGCGTVILSLSLGDNWSKRVKIDPIEDFLWNGVGQARPTLRVTANNGDVLTEGVGYTAVFENNEAHGTATVTVTAIAPYLGSATRTFKILRSYCVANGAPDAGTGSDWENPISLKGALTAAQEKDEIWLRAETISLSAAVSSSAAVTLRGGFAGTETHYSQRTGDKHSVIDGSTTILNMVTFTASSGNVLVERVDFVRAKHGALRLSGDANFVVTNCLFVDNVNVDGYPYYGGALYACGSQKTGTLRVTDCRFEGNIYRKLGYAYNHGTVMNVQKIGRAFFDNCLFVTNGIAPSYAGQQTGNLPGADGGFSVYYFSNAPLTATGCRFLGNRSAICDGSISGPHIYLTGTAGVNAFTNCLFAGNASHNTKTSGSTVGSLINLVGDSTATPLIISRCTFAYNVADTCYSACAVTVQKGALTVRESIFYGNLGRLNRSYGVDIHLGTGSADIDYSLFSGLGTDNITGVAVSGFGAHNITGDAAFATPFADFSSVIENAKGTAATVYGVTRVNDTAYFSPKADADLIHYDFHLKSTAGRWNGSGWTADATTSAAIDGGDPDSDYSREPNPNGERRNLGFYGNTVEASKTPNGQPSFDGDVTVDQETEEYSNPHFRFALGGSEAYLATVYVCFGATDGGDDLTAWDVVRTPSVSAGIGDQFDVAAATFLEKGSTVYWRVIVRGNVSPFKTAYKTGSFTVAKDQPPWYGRGDKTGKVIHVWDGAIGEGTGASWADAVPTLGDALGILAADATKDEIWLNEGTILLTSAVSISPGRSFKLRGGFTHMEDTADARTAGHSTVFSGGKTLQNMFACSFASGLTCTIDGIDFIHAKHGALRFSGDGNLSVTNCLFFNNVNVDSYPYHGGALYAKGTARTGTIRVTDCRFEGNIYRAGGYMYNNGTVTYAESVARVYFDNCLFMTNGIAPSFAGLQSGNLPGAGGGNCYVYYFKNAPLTATGCRFLGNRSGIASASSTGPHFYIHDTTETSTFESCLFAGNAIHSTNTGSTDGSLIVFYGNSASAPLNISRCTFGYNVADTYNSACAVTVRQGKLTVRDSIFYGNLGRLNRAYGVDIHVGNGTANIDYSLFSGLGTDNITGVEDFEFGSHNITGDASFATPFSDFSSTLENAPGTAATVSDVTRVNDTAHFSPKADADLIHYDLHLQSSAGRWNGTGWTTDGTVSRAIDGGDPDSDYSREPNPNGERRNLGFYGNTVEASKTPNGQPSFDGDVTVDQETEEYSNPHFRFALGGSEAYLATVYVCFGATDGGDDLTAWDFVRTPSIAAVIGDQFNVAAGSYFEKGSTLYWRVIVRGNASPNKSAYKTGSFTVAKEWPPYYGHGDKTGKAIHVWPGAMGKGTGTSWADAVATIDEALVLLENDPTKSEIWLPTNVIVRKQAPATLAISRPLMIRGGFTIYDDTPEDRVAGAVTTIDGNSAYKCLQFANTARVTLERLRFWRGIRESVYKTGAGDLVFDDCRFEDCVKAGGVSHTGGALHATGTAGITTLAMTNCVFAGNVNTASGNTFSIRGFTTFINEFKRVTLESCLFVTNGVKDDWRTATSGTAPSTEGQPRAVGGTFYFENAPLTARNCRFIGNLSICGRQMGTMLEFEKNCGGTALSNCLFLANCTVDPHALDAVMGACVSMYDDNAANTYDFVNCTFAYNTSASKNSSAALNVYKGKARVKNSIFYGNLIRGGTSYGADLHVCTGSAEVDYTLFGGLDAEHIRKGSGGTIVTNNCFAADPLFMTEYYNVTNNLYSGTSKTTPTGVRGPNANFAIGKDAGYATWNAHLRGYRGYFDEKTGHLVRDKKVLTNPAVDAGDPASDYSKEPAGANGKRINLGFYGNTPYATRSASTGFSVIVK